jgi:NodT family efflux transporter outer membrane factor (OMF) lipoprotein
MRTRRILVTCLVLALASCRVGPNYHPPTLPKDAEAPLVSLDARLETSELPPERWWQLYEDPRLDELIREALAANRDLAAADAHLLAARAALSGVRASRYPSTDAAVGGVYGRDPVTEEILELNGNPPQTLWLFEDVFQVAYEVDLFGRVHRAIEAATANAEAVAATRDAVSVAVVSGTARGYATVCALGEELRVAHRSLEVVTHEAEITVERHDAGGNTEFDVTRSEALVAQVRATIPRLEGARRAVLFELTALLGRVPANAPRDLEACDVAPHLTSLIPVGDGRALISRRPDVREAERRLAAATAEIGVATADLYPTIRLAGFYGGAATQFSELGTNPAEIWGIGPSISWNFPNQAGPRARVRAAKASRAAALASFDSVVLTALKETEQALVTYTAALENRQALADSQAKTRRAFEIAQQQFEAGSLSMIDLLTTEQSLVGADAAVATVDVELVQDQIALFKALGGGWRANN